VAPPRQAAQFVARHFFNYATLAASVGDHFSSILLQTHGRWHQAEEKNPDTSEAKLLRRLAINIQLQLREVRIYTGTAVRGGVDNYQNCRNLPKSTENSMVITI